MPDFDVADLVEEVRKLREAIERRAGPAPLASDLSAADCFVWDAQRSYLQPVAKPNRIGIGLIRGVDRVRDILLENTQRFARGLPANNVLLWGARGMGKSSLIKAVHAETAHPADGGRPLKLIEIHREDIDTLPRLMAILREADVRCLLSATICPSITTIRHTNR
jgi:predicted AAA+ superfamily ATPase